MSCLFNSFDQALGISNSREQICDYIENNLNEEINGETIRNWIIYSANDMNLDINSYMNKMRHSSTWGGGPELMIASKMYNVIIVVVKDNKEIEFNSLGLNHNKDRIIYLNYNGSHYWNNSNKNNCSRINNQKSIDYNGMNNQKSIDYNGMNNQKIIDYNGMNNLSNMDNLYNVHPKFINKYSHINYIHNRIPRYNINIPDNRINLSYNRNNLSYNRNNLSFNRNNQTYNRNNLSYNRSNSNIIPVGNLLFSCGLYYSQL